MNRWIANTIGGLVIVILVVGGALAAWRTWHKPSAAERAKNDLSQDREKTQAQAQAQAEQQLQDLKDGCEQLNGKKDPVEFADGGPKVDDWRWGKPSADWQAQSMSTDTAVTAFAGFNAVNFEACWSPTLAKRFKGKGEFMCSAGGASTIILECKTVEPPSATTAPPTTTTTEQSVAVRCGQTCAFTDSPTTLVPASRARAIDAQRSDCLRSGGTWRPDANSPNGFCDQ